MSTSAEPGVSPQGQGAALASEPAQSESLRALAARFLSEAVYAAREQSHRFHPGEGASACGLGERPSLPETWSPAQARVAAELFQSLEAHGREGELAPALEGVAGAWVQVQDGLDRKRNHFIKGFRQQHGADRKAYAPEVEQAFRDGLELINADSRERLARAAEEMLLALREAHRR